MNAKEAKSLLQGECSTSQSTARINRGMTQAQATGIVARCVNEMADDAILPPWMEQRVLQVTLRVCPRCHPQK